MTKVSWVTTIQSVAITVIVYVLESNIYVTLCVSSLCATRYPFRWQSMGECQSNSVFNIPIRILGEDNPQSAKYRPKCLWDFFYKYQHNPGICWYDLLYGVNCHNQANIIQRCYRCSSVETWLQRNRSGTDGLCSPQRHRRTSQSTALQW